VLDGFAGAEHLEVRRRYREAHRECARLEAELAELRERDGSRERDLDLYRYELSEIEAVAPDAAEEAELLAERERLRHAEGLREAAAGALAGSAAPRESTPSSTRSGSGSALSRSSWGTSAPSCAPTSKGSRAIPSGSPRSRSGSTRSSA